MATKGTTTSATAYLYLQQSSPDDRARDNRSIADLLTTRGT